MKYLIIYIILITSCSYPEYPTFETPQDVFDWVNNNIDYINDDRNILSEFRSYSSITSTMSGDCSQYSTISIILLDWHLGIKADLVAIKLKSGILHAVIEMNQELVDPFTYPDFSYIEENYKLFARVDHDLVMLLYGH